VDIVCKLRIIAVGLTLAGLAAAQTPTGTIQGTVTDSQGGLIPGAKVTITKVETNETKVILTNAAGRYVQPFLLPGDYTVEVRKEGFKPVRQTDIKLDVAQNRSVDARLEVGVVTTEVQVVAAPPPLDLNNAVVGQIIENKQIMDLPLNGRSAFGLAALAPGVNTTGGGATPGLGGGRNSVNELQIDGVTDVYAGNNIGLAEKIYEPQVDAVSEFSVQVNNLSAEYGRFGGGVINVATKSGTNRIHGTAYEFLRNSKLDSNNFFSNKNRVPLASFKRNQWGGTLGGPIRRDKTFFFFGYEGLNARTASASTFSVPTEAWRSGNFAGLKNAKGQNVTIYDPLTANVAGDGKYYRAPFANNVIPESRMDKVGKALMQYYPLPNATPVNQYTQSSNYYAVAAAPTDTFKMDSRIDQNWSDRFRTFLRVSLGGGETAQANLWKSVATPSGDGVSQLAQRSISLDSTYTVSPTLIANVRYGFGRTRTDRAPFGGGFDFAKELGFPQEMMSMAARNYVTFPVVSVESLSRLGQATFTAYNSQGMVHQASGSVTKILRRNTLKAGMEYRKSLLNFTQYDSPSGSFSVQQQWTRKMPTTWSDTEGFGAATLLLGNAGGYMSHEPALSAASGYTAFYLQNEWKVTRRLMVSVGLRYEWESPRTERFDRLAYFDMYETSPMQGQVPADACLNCGNLRGAMHFVSADRRQQAPTDRNNWGPRVGLAYYLGWKTAIRAGYGIAYAPSALQAAGVSGGIGITGYKSNTSSTVSLDSGITPWSTLSNPFRSGWNLPAGTSYGAGTDMGGQIDYTLFDSFATPYIQQWNFNIQREMPGKMVVEAGYLALRGIHLIDGDPGQYYNVLPTSYMQLGEDLLTKRVDNPFYGKFPNPQTSLAQLKTVEVRQLLRPYPQYTDVRSMRKPIGSSMYHGMIIKVDKRFSNGFSFLVSYTAGKEMDDCAHSVNYLGSITGTRLDPYNRKLEWSVGAMDVPQRLVTSYNFELPFGKNKPLLNHLPRAVNLLVGGWQLNGIVTFQSGNPLWITNVPNQTYIYTPAQRANADGRSARITGSRSVDEKLGQWFDTTVFSIPAKMTLGTVGRTLPDVRRPGNRTTDFSLFKSVTFGPDHRWKAQYRLEMFNATNTPQFNGPNTDIQSGSFGKITGAGSARQVQMALKLIW